MPPVPGQNASLPLLAAQRQQWASHHDDPANPRYNCGGYFRLTGELDRNALAAAVTAAYSETDALRVVFHERDGQPRQTVRRPGPVPLSPVVAADESAATEWMNAQLAVPFDLRDNGPLCTHALIETSEDEQIFFFRYHHITLDALGAHRYLRRVAQHYNSLMEGIPAPDSGFASLNRLVAEEDAYRSSARASRDDAYWSDVMAAPTASSALVQCDKPAQPRPLRSLVRVPDAARLALLDLCTREDVRWPVVVKAVVACLLGKANDSDDVVIGMLAANRPTLAAVKTPVNMANELPLRVAVHTNATFAELLGQVARRVGEAMTHQRAHLDRLHTPLALRTFVNVITIGEQPRFTGCASEFHVLATGPASNFRVNCYGEPTSELLLEFEVNPLAYGRNELNRYQEFLLELLHDLVSSPHVRLADLLGSRV